MLTHAEGNLKDSPFSASLELSTKYMWRGIEYGTAPTVFPMIGYNTHGFNAFAMGAYAIDGSHQEVDFGVSYTASEFTIGVSDYYYPSETIIYPRPNDGISAERYSDGEQLYLIFVGGVVFYLLTNAYI